MGIWHHCFAHVYACVLVGVGTRATMRKCPRWPTNIRRHGGRGLWLAIMYLMLLLQTDNEHIDVLTWGWGRGITHMHSSIYAYTSRRTHVPPDAHVHDSTHTHTCMHANKHACMYHRAHECTSTCTCAFQHTPADMSPYLHMCNAATRQSASLNKKRRKWLAYVN